MKNLKFNFKSIVRSKARWLLTLIAILTIGVGEIFGQCAKDQVFYFRPSTSNKDWTESGARFAVKFRDVYGNSSYVAWYSCIEVPGDDGTYYAVAPAAFYKFQFCRMNGSNGTNSDSNVWAWSSDLSWDGTNHYNLFTRKSDGNWDGDCNWGKYAPPMSSVELSKTATVYGGDGSEANPFIVATSSTINFSTTATSAVTADSQTKYYQFYKKEGSNSRSTWGSKSTTNTKSLTVSSSAGVTYAIDVEAQNEYYSTYGSAKKSNVLYFRTIVVPVWSIRGGDGEDTDGKSDAMGDWGVVYNALTNTSGTTWRTTMSLAGNTTYTFKVVNNGSTYYGRNSAFIGQTSVHTMSTGEGNCHLLTAETGTYTFEFDSNTKDLKVLFPEVTHPTADYIYFKNPSWSSVYVHLWKNSPAANADTYPGPVPGTTSITTSSGTATYYYAAIGGCDRAKFNDNGSNATSDLTDVTTHKGYWWKQTSPYGWQNFTFSVTLNTNGGTIKSGNVTTYNFGTGATLPTNVEKDGYTRAGWYDNASFSGSAITAISATDKGNKSYNAKWTQSVPLNKHNGSDNGSVTMTYNSNSHPAITNPTKSGYTFAGWYTAESGGALVINTSGVLQNSTSYTDASGKWTNSGSAPTLHAQWTEDTHTVTITAGSHGSVDPVSVSGVGIATASEAIEAIADEGYHFVSWTLPESGVTIASGAGTKDITINATADSKTITANFEANSYTVVFNANYPSGKRFDNGGSMSNQGFTYDVAQNLTANAFGCEGYTFAGWATTAERANAGTVDHTNGKSVNNLTSENGGTFNLYAVWTDDNVYYFDGGASGTDSDWEDDANWTKGKAPSSLDNHEVRLLKHADIDNSTGTVHVKSVRIYMNGSYTPTGGSEITVSENGGYLYIWSRGALVVKNDILNYDMSTGTESPTTWRSLQIWADQYGSGALIVGDHQEGNKADVTFYTKACYGGSAGSYVNQFFGIPYTSSSPLNYYGVYLYKYNLNAETYEQSFDPASSGTMTPFTAYLMLRTDAEPGYCYTDGELILPGIGEYKAQNLDLVYSTTKGVSNMFANSWMGPIDLRAMETAGDGNDFVGVEATIYMFNAGSSNDVGENASEGNSPGQWTVLPVNAVKTDADDGTMDTYAQCVIPSQQAFLVVATQSGTTHQLKLDYKKHVYDPFEDNDVTIVPTRAPRREDFVLPEQMDLYVTGTSGNSDRVIIYAREDFSTGFDNGWEGYKINGSNFAPQMYTLGDNGKMAINAIPDVEGSVIGFKPGTEDVQYTFTFKYRGENTWYLNDLKEQTSTLIDELDSYTFTSAEGDMEARFIISRTPIAYMPTGIDNGGGAVEGVSVRKLMIDGTLYIIRNGQMFTAEGQMVK